jgi:hypothetical protein
MDDRLFEAYDQYAIERVRAGIIDHSLDAAALDGKTVREHVVEVLREAGRLPAGWDDDPVWRPIPRRRIATDSLVKKPAVTGKHARLLRAYLPYAS